MRFTAALYACLFLAACNGSGGGGPKKVDGPPEGEAVLRIENTDGWIGRIDWRDWPHGGIPPEDSWETLWPDPLPPNATADCGLVAAGTYDFRFWTATFSGFLVRQSIRVEPDKNGVFLLSHH